MKLNNIMLYSLLFVTILSCESTITNSPTNADTTKTQKEEKPVRQCYSTDAQTAVQNYLISTGLIQFSNEIKFRETTKLNDNCDFKITVQFFLRDLVNGDGYKDYRVGYDGSKYFVY
ncbi:MAG: hypothetical protein Q8L07_14610 [Sediminibacterium sp.]|nr:hypothetical protein [Sediminibacterium sp.]